MNSPIIAMLFAVLGCREPDPHHLPRPSLPEDAWVVREAFQGPGPDRTGNWRGWFDRSGCWWEEHNTWLIVTDPALLANTAHHLHWNAVRPDAPWFCLSEMQVEILMTAVQASHRTPPNARYLGPVERWIVHHQGQPPRVAVVPRGSDGEGWSPILRVFRELAAMSVWGQSPENP
ncbi:MAG: hypothetical protein VX127_03305 [Myxococcota bacterium]|nr:hypothetical protein [Myxococcota bacterium]